MKKLIGLFLSMLVVVPACAQYGIKQDIDWATNNSDSFGTLLVEVLINESDFLARCDIEVFNTDDDDEPVASSSCGNTIPLPVANYFLLVKPYNITGDVQRELGPISITENHITRVLITLPTGALVVHATSGNRLLAGIVFIRKQDQDTIFASAGTGQHIVLPLETYSIAVRYRRAVKYFNNVELRSSQRRVLRAVF